MKCAEEFLISKLNERIENGSFRLLSYKPGLVDFCSNDYLGMARNPALGTIAHSYLQSASLNGATGSRLLSGNHIFFEETEAYLANFHHAEAGLIFNSGYVANLGLLSSLAQRGDTIICDELIHASLIDGARLSYAERQKFKHNDLADLEKKLTKAKGVIYVVVESVYSMDGDEAPLEEIALLCEQFGACLIVDEAHATGVFGQSGQGLVQHLGLENRIFARVATFGKAIGLHGAVVLGSENLRKYLINFARSFIYTTALPPHQIAQVRATYQIMETGRLTAQLHRNINNYKMLVKNLDLPIQSNNSAIQTIVLGSNQKAKNCSEQLQKNGFDVRAILSPTVPQGSERLRICLHSFNTEDEIERLVQVLKKLLK